MLWLLLACTGDEVVTSDSDWTPPSHDTGSGATDASGYTGLSAEADRTCVLDPTGALACFDVTAGAWSRSQETPAGLFTHVSAGGCGMRSGIVYCWDPDEHGTAEPPDDDFTTVERGAALACALDDIGQVSCWGDTAVLTGSIATSDRIESSLAVSGDTICGVAAAGEVVCDGVLPGGGAGPYTQVAVGGDVCALDQAGAVSCWSGAAVPAGTDLHHVAVGAAGVCALTATGDPACGGTDAVYAQPPTDLPPLRSLAAGSAHLCGLDHADALHCWFEGPDGILVVTETP